MVIKSFNGPQNIRLYLLQAERLIRLRGIPKVKKSTKIRLLHHTYTHLRIIVESIFPPSTTKSCDNGPQQGNSYQTGNLRRFGLEPNNLNSSWESSSMKSDEIGYDDIHLEAQGHWSMSLYMDMYGIPESLMTLLSKVVCLANDKLRLERLAKNDPLIHAALDQHVQNLEKELWNWDVYFYMAQASGDSSDANSSLGDVQCLNIPEIKSMILAFHQALMIYFYRRIHKVHPMVLQSLVASVLSHLEPCMMGGSEERDFASSINKSNFSYTT